jgi:hypothetical protein
MYHEKIFKREDGSRVKLMVSVMFLYNKLVYRCSTSTCIKGKRTWISTTNTDNYTYRALGMKDRKKVEEADMMKVVTPEEILEARLETWQLLKPKGI